MGKDMKMASSKKRRIKDLIILIAINLTLLVVALLFKLIFEGRGDVAQCYLLNEFSIPCPTCGGSRAVYALLRLDIISAFIFYPPLFAGIFLLLHFDILSLIHIVKPSSPLPAIPKWEYLILPLSIILFFITRLVLLFGFGVDLLKVAAF